MEPGAQTLDDRPTPTEAVEPFGRYVLRSTLASGGMASVHLATCTSADGSKQVVAIKKLHPHLEGDPGFAAMFLDEARIHARISHPNVCAVLDDGAVNGVQYLALEYLLGEPLRELIPMRKQVAAGAHGVVDRFFVSWIADACDGLHEAHELRDDDGRPLDVVHRDISPHNLVVTYDGVVKIIDFGVARAKQRVHHTSTGTVKGKFAYMAPEQMRGAIVDRRADIWALGVILWECLAGRPLFRRWADSETVLAVLSEDVPRLRDHRPDLSEELAAIVDRALSRSKELRHPTARALASDLRAWLDRTGTRPDPKALAAWVRRLFPERLDAKTKAIERALRAWDAGVDREFSLDDLAGGSRSAIVPSRAPPRGRGSSRRWLFLLAPLVVGGVVAGIAVAPKGPTTHESKTSFASGVEEPTEVIVSRVPADAPERAPAVVEAPVPPSPPVAKRHPIPDGRANAEAGAPRRVVRTVQVNVAARGGWANVFVGGRLLGPTPGTFVLPEGRHTLTFRTADGRVLARRSLVAHAGRVSRITVELSP